MNTYSALRWLAAHAPWLKRAARGFRRRFMSASGVSTGYVELDASQAGHESSRLRGSWQSQELPRKQRELVDRQLEAYRRGEPIDVFRVLADSVRTLPGAASGMTLLEVGCSSGFYSEVLSVAGLNVSYTGCDYSEAFVSLARRIYPNLKFDVADATALPYEDGAFDIVVSGCCLLHIPEYPQAIRETARVAGEYAIFHRTPVVVGQPTVYYRKQAYGVETVEIHFNEPQFLELLTQSGLELLATYTLDEAVQEGRGSANRTYVCRKR